MRILFVSANPHWTARLDLAEELRTMQKSTADCDPQITLLPAAQLEDLEKAIEGNTFDIVHFSGHATKDEGLLFRKANGDKDEISPEKLRALLKGHNIKLAVLNACNTDATVEGIKGVVDASIGTDDALDDRSAKLLTKVLYSELAKGSPVNKAYSEAKRVIIDNKFDNAYLPELTLNENSDTSISFEKTRLADDEQPIQGRTEYDRYFFANYLGEQISVLDRNIKLNRYVLWALVAIGVGMLLFDWGQHVSSQNPDGVWGVLEQIGTDIWNFMLLALGALAGKAEYSEDGTPFLDWLMQLGQITPLAIATLQYRWCVHGFERRRELTALKEIVDGSEELDADVMSRLHNILDQSLRTADTEFKDLREFLPEPIKPAADRLLDRTFGANIE